MISTLLTTPCTLLLRSNSGSTDDYGNAIESETEVETVCAVQQQRRTEPGEHDDLSDTSWLGFFPVGTDLEAADAVEVDGHGTFELIGDPWPVDDHELGTTSHVEATLRRTGRESGS